MLGIGLVHEYSGALSGKLMLNATISSVNATASPPTPERGQLTPFRVFTELIPMVALTPFTPTLDVRSPVPLLQGQLVRPRENILSYTAIPSTKYMGCTSP